MNSMIMPKSKSDIVFQPSTFEEKIYTFLIYQYESKKKSEQQVESIEFETSDFIVDFLGNKMNSTRDTEVEQALKNLKNTMYTFDITGYSREDNSAIRNEPIRLISEYSSFMKEKKIYTVALNRKIRKIIEEMKNTKYVIKSFGEILAKDAIANRICGYISKVGNKKNKDEVDIRTLAAIIPLQTVQISEKIDKDGKIKRYYFSKIKAVLKRIEKAFDVLIELGYIEEYGNRYVKEEDTYYINYVFNQKKEKKK